MDIQSKIDGLHRDYYDKFEDCHTKFWQQITQIRNNDRSFAKLFKKLELCYPFAEARMNVLKSLKDDEFLLDPTYKMHVLPSLDVTLIYAPYEMKEYFKHKHSIKVPEIFKVLCSLFCAILLFAFCFFMQIKINLMRKLKKFLIKLYV